MNRVPASREAFKPSTNDATPELSMYLTFTRFITTRGVLLSLISFSNAFRISGEFAKSISPVISKIVVVSILRAEICKAFSPLKSVLLLRLQILDQAQLVCPLLALEFHNIHALPYEM